MNSTKYKQQDFYHIYNRSNRVNNYINLLFLLNSSYFSNTKKTQNSC